MKKSKKKQATYAEIDCSSEMKRLNRIVGQIEGIRKMLDEQRKLNDVLTQCKAVQSAMKSIEARIFRAYIESSLEEITKIGKKKNRQQKLAELQELYKQAS